MVVHTPAESERYKTDWFLFFLLRGVVLVPVGCEVRREYVEGARAPLPPGPALSYPGWLWLFFLSFRFPCPFFCVFVCEVLEVYSS